jgi:RNA-directed DNA polymerase
MKETSGSEQVSTKPQRVANLARQAPDMVLTTLAHHIDMEFLKEAYRRTRKNSAPGIDGQTAAEYAKDLNANLESLLERFKSGRYKAPAVRRTYIPKGDGTGKFRELGIPTFEDKILQRAVTMVLEAIYEQEFYDFSHAYRPGRTQHQALQTMWKCLMDMGHAWVLEIDIQDCFGSLDHKVIRNCLDRRVQDGVIRKAIDKWLSAGVMERGEITYPEDGAPQGAVISPILSNIYLHEVADRWFVREVQPRLRGESHMMRWADDIVMIFSNEADARRVLEVLPKRFGKYQLTLHPTKTKLTEFRRPTNSAGDDSGTFDFLGFTHYWGRSRQGQWVVRRKTSSKRFRSRVKAVAEWCRANRHQPILDQHQTLVRKLNGHYQYYGLTGNARCLQNFHRQVTCLWFKWLNRRSEKKHLSWEKFLGMLKILSLPRPHIAHSYLRARPAH